MALLPANKKSIQILLCLLVTLSGCQENQNTPLNHLEQNLTLAGPNRPELEKVLAHYQKSPEDSLKLKSAIFLISNIEDKVHYDGPWLRQYDSLFSTRSSSLGQDQLNKFKDSIRTLIGQPGKKGIKTYSDLQTLEADYLIKNIDHAFNSWQRAPWKDQVDFDTFCNYILPYKEYNELPDDWRTSLFNKYRHIPEDPDIPTNMEDWICAQIEEQKNWLKYSDAGLNDYPGALNVSQILQTRLGGCIEFSNIGVMAARAFGIPAAVDYVIGHNWDVLILPEGKFISYEGAESRPGDHTNIREADSKFTKVYRRKAGYDSTSFAALARQAGVKEIPYVLDNPRITDVTASYTLTYDLAVHIDEKEGTPVYLCPFIKSGFEPRAGSLVKNNQAIFLQTAKREIYVPMFYINYNYIPAGPPILVPVYGETKELWPRQDQPQSMTVSRMYPFRRWMERIVEEPLISARFEASNDPGFNRTVLLHEIQKTSRPYRGKLYNDLDQKDRYAYDSIWKQIEIKQPDSFRYVRLVFNKHHPFRLGELEFYNLKENQSTRKPLTGAPIGNISDVQFAFDGFPGRSIKKEKDTSAVQWVGMDLGKKFKIDQIRYLAAGDSHFVEVGKRYELFYWKDKWVSAGIKPASGISIEFQQIPSDAVYLLKCLDCENREVRPFTYEYGKQVWW